MKRFSIRTAVVAVYRRLHQLRESSQRAGGASGAVDRGALERGEMLLERA